MGKGQTNSEFMRYFPDAFKKRTPPWKYFWQVLSALEPEKNLEVYNYNLSLIKTKIKKPEPLKITPEHRQILLFRQEENFSLALALKRIGVEKNIRYLRRTKNEEERKSITNIVTDEKKESKKEREKQAESGYKTENK